MIKLISNEYKKRFVIDGYKKGAISYDYERLPWYGCLGEIEKEKISLYLKENLILECGVGTGRHALYFGNNYTYVGIDLSHEMIKICKSNTKNMNKKTELILCDAESLVFRKDIFDILICSKTFKFFTSPLKFLEEAKGSLKKGGRCLITFEVLDSFWFRFAKKLGLKVPKHEKHYFINDGIYLFRKAGFSHVEVEPVANLLLGIYLFLWYVTYNNPLRQIFYKQVSSFIKIIIKVDNILSSRFFVLFKGEA
ncbi:MAG: class I SAM-dependent methyltransferase [Candidatus Hodarchaeota archaeon]